MSLEIVFFLIRIISILSGRKFPRHFFAWPGSYNISIIIMPTLVLNLCFVFFVFFFCDFENTVFRFRNSAYRYDRVVPHTKL